ncbi:MAG: NAD(P)H-hydrate dehydratase [Candidatus Caenarcaniphilales bacterium]|nr:NAD(P)H-hydrate dehydratase [Candidatus Caenarcaniphilales bacterium]
MYRVLKSEEIKNIDQTAVAEQGFFYMQRAAQGLFQLIEKLITKHHQKFLLSFPKIIIFAGKGNNGGDGILLAAELLKHGYKVKVYSLVEAEYYQGESGMAYQLFVQAGGKLDPILNEADLISVKHMLLKQKNSILVDSLLGIGAEGSPKGFYAKLIEYINQSRNETSSITISVDIPSGIDVDNGNVFEPAITADYTVQMGFLKLSSLFYPAKQNFGEVIVHELKYPNDLVDKESPIPIFYADKEFARNLIPERKIDGNKFDHGVGLLVAGSEGMTGAAMLSASAALRSGLGLLHIFTQKSGAPVIANNLWEAVLHTYDENHKTNIEAVKDLLTSRKVDALALGPGMSLSGDSVNLNKNIIELLSLIQSRPVILDADAINAFVGNLEMLRAFDGQILLTPHAREFSRLFDLDISDLAPYEKAEKLSSIAKEYGVNILYKGAPTYIASAEGKVFIVPTGCSALAKAGSGDILTGLILSFTAQGLTLVDAAILSSYMHNLMGLIAADKLSEYSVLARDLVEAISPAINDLLLTED